jgi:spore germination protein KA
MSKPPAHSLQDLSPDCDVDFSAALADNISLLRRCLDDCYDIVFHSFAMADGTGCCAVFVPGYSDRSSLEKQVLLPLASSAKRETSSSSLPGGIAGNSYTELSSVLLAVDRICAGYPLLLIDGYTAAWAFHLVKPEQRSVEEPIAESTVRGPRDGFTEALGVNLPLLRQRLKTPNLKMIRLTLGRFTKTDIVLVYLKGMARPELVSEVRRRLELVQSDGILESEMIEEWISDNPFSPFPQMLPTERPDVVCANLMEGRIAILIDGTPFALVAPISLFSMLQSPEDYYQNVLSSTFLRWLRYGFFIVSLVLPSAYIAITTFHQEMIPTVLLLNISKSREEIPFPALIEALIMEITFEALREAGVRLPKQVGSAVSIVGALVIGQAATSAGIVSAPMVIVVAITGISSFMIPRYSLGIPPRLLRFPIMLLAGTMGLVGVMLGFIAMVIHLCRLRSFGLPYLSPISPVRLRELRDIFLRPPAWRDSRQPELAGESLEPENADRGSTNMKRRTGNDRAR